MQVVAAPDKFKGTATAAEICTAIAEAATERGHTCGQVPLADGGDGTLEVLGGPNQTSTVTGPLGEPVDAQWRFDAGVAVIEMARTSGLVLAGGPEGNDPLGATTTGVGELISEAIDLGAKKIIVGVGGSATTDGGLGAVEVLGSPQRLAGIEVIIACDVRTRFVDAASVFGPQKGATAAQVAMLTDRLTALVGTYRERFGVDISDFESAGAAGGLAGGLAALGAYLADGFAIVAEQVGLTRELEGADLVVTGEGSLDNESFEGKVVGGVATLAASFGVPVLAVAGQVVDGVGDRIDAISLSEEFGFERATSAPGPCVHEALLRRW